MHGHSVESPTSEVDTTECVQDHIYSHQCPFCLETDKGEFQIRRHMKLCRSSTISESAAHQLQCFTCGKLFRNSRNLWRHRQVHKDRELKCHVCQKMFKTTFYLKRHMNTHIVALKTKHPCHDCGETFSGRTALKMHEKIHLGVMDYQCQYCFKTFYQKGNLKLHLVNCKHKRENLIKRNTSLKCTTCQVQFMVLSRLEMHMKGHTGEKPFKCRYCNEGFVMEINREQHELSRQELKVCVDGLDDEARSQEEEDKECVIDDDIMWSSGSVDIDTRSDDNFSTALSDLLC